MSDKEFEERFNEAWNELCDEDDNACIASNDLKNALDHAGYKLPNHQVRELAKDLENKGLIQDKGITKENFKKICQQQHSKRTSRQFTSTTKLQKDDFIKTTDDKDRSYAYHMISKEEQRSFASWINENLGNNKQCAHLLPLQDDGEDLYSKCADGILLCYLINLAKPDTIDERAINKGSKMSIFKRHENLTMAILSAKAIGINVINIDSHIVEEGKKTHHFGTDLANHRHLFVRQNESPILSWPCVSLAGRRNFGRPHEIDSGATFDALDQLPT